jgi:hypothetical protein
MLSVEVHMSKHVAVLLVFVAFGAAACGSGDADTGSQDITSTTSTASGGQASLWEQDVCTLLSDEEVAAVAGGSSPSEAQSSSQGTVAADGYGGSSCRWKVSVSQFVEVDVYPNTEGRLDELAAYNPWDRWTVETYSGIGEDARLVVATGDSGLETPGTIQALVVQDGDVGIRIALTDKYPATPDGLVAAAQRLLEQK